MFSCLSNHAFTSWAHLLSMKYMSQTPTWIRNVLPRRKTLMLLSPRVSWSKISLSTLDPQICSILNHPAKIKLLPLKRHWLMLPTSMQEFTLPAYQRNLKSWKPRVNKLNLSTNKASQRNVLCSKICFMCTNMLNSMLYIKRKLSHCIGDAIFK